MNDNSGQRMPVANNLFITSDVYKIINIAPLTSNALKIYLNRPTPLSDQQNPRHRRQGHIQSKREP